MASRRTSEKRKAPEHPMGTSFFMGDTLQRLGIDFNDPRRRLFADWDQLGLGEIGEHCQPSDLRFGTLYIGCDNGAWATSVHLKKGEIISLIRSKYPTLVIKSVRVFTKG